MVALPLLRLTSRRRKLKQRTRNLLKASKPKGNQATKLNNKPLRLFNKLLLAPWAHNTPGTSMSSLFATFWPPGTTPSFMLQISPEERPLPESQEE